MIRVSSRILHELRCFGHVVLPRVLFSLDTASSEKSSKTFPKSKESIQWGGKERSGEEPPHPHPRILIWEPGQFEAQSVEIWSVQREPRSGHVAGDEPEAQAEVAS